MFKALLTGLAAIAAATAVHAQDASKSPAGAKVTILEPANGATVSSPVTVKFGIEGMELSPAGTEKAGSGHHHLLIDTKLPMNVGDQIPFNNVHRHFGKAQTGTSGASSRQRESATDRSRRRCMPSAVMGAVA